MLEDHIANASEPSPYHRKLFAATITQQEKFVPLSADEQQALWPTWWNATQEERLKEDILIGIVTTRYAWMVDTAAKERNLLGQSLVAFVQAVSPCARLVWERYIPVRYLTPYSMCFVGSSALHNRLFYQRASWWYDDRLDMVEVYSDVEKDPTIPNLVYSHCDSSYHYGLWCKNKHLLQMWGSPRYRKYKWFIRANDDSYYHLENIYEFVSQLDHTKPIIIGEKYCYNSPSIAYPSGGAGIILSRGFVDSMNWDIWDNPLKRKTPIRMYFEDVLWGRYLEEVGGVQFIQHHGISQSAMLPTTEQSKLFLQYRNHPWPFPFRPLAYHQAGKWSNMVSLHKMLHSIDYFPQAKHTFQLPACQCRANFHSRCYWDTAKTSRLSCRWNSLLKICLGPEDYTLDGYHKLEKKLNASST